MDRHQQRHHHMDRQFEYKDGSLIFLPSKYEVKSRAHAIDQSFVLLTKDDIFNYEEEGVYVYFENGKWYKMVN